MPVVTGVIYGEESMPASIRNGALVVLAGCSSAWSAQAQEAQASAPEETIEEVVVTGFRASLGAALDDKRASSAAIDSIRAEDIAKFPDGTGGTPDFDTPLGDTLPASIDPETAAGLASNLRAALPRIRELLGLLTRRGKEDG